MTEQELSQQSVPNASQPAQFNGFGGVGDGGVSNSSAQQQYSPEQFSNLDMTMDNNYYQQNQDSSYAYQNQQYYLPNQPEPEYLVLEWLADSRLSLKRSKEFYSSIAVIVLLFSLILFFANQVLLIFVLVSMLFLSYVLATVRPDTIHNMITTYGIRYQNKLYLWQELGNFWITEHNGKYQIHIEAPVFLSNRIVLLPSNDDSPIYVQMEDIVDLLARYLPYQEPTPTQIDRWVLWVQEKFPLEPPQKQKLSTPQSKPQSSPSMTPESQNSSNLKPTEVPKL